MQFFIRSTYQNFRKLWRSVLFLRKSQNHLNLKSLCERCSKTITAMELASAKRVLIISTQSTAFSKKTHVLKYGDNSNPKSWLIYLKSFLGKQRILRVGGRLIHSELSATFYSLCKLFWPFSGKHITRKMMYHYCGRLYINERRAFS